MASSFLARISVISLFLLSLTAHANELDSTFKHEVFAGVGTPLGLEGSYRVSVEGQTLGAGVETSLAPLFGLLTPSVGLFGKVKIGTGENYYVKAGVKHTTVNLPSSDLRSINTRSLGLGKVLASGTRVEVDFTRADRTHRDFCNYQDCTPNGQSSRNGVMVSVGSAF